MMLLEERSKKRGRTIQLRRVSSLDETHQQRCRCVKYCRPIPGACKRGARPLPNIESSPLAPVHSLLPIHQNQDEKRRKESRECLYVAETRRQGKEKVERSAERSGPRGRAADVLVGRSMYMYKSKRDCGGNYLTRERARTTAG